MNVRSEVRIFQDAGGFADRSHGVMEGLRGHVMVYGCSVVRGTDTVCSVSQRCATAPWHGVMCQRIDVFAVTDHDFAGSSQLPEAEIKKFVLLYIQLWRRGLLTSWMQYSVEKEEMSRCWHNMFVRREFISSNYLYKWGGFLPFTQLVECNPQWDRNIWDIIS